MTATEISEFPAMARAAEILDRLDGYGSARARGGSSQLAAYLFDKKNDRVTVIEITGTQQEELRGALREMEAVGLNATTSQQVLYHAYIAPAHADTLTQGQFVEAVNRLEKGLGLTWRRGSVAKKAETSLLLTGEPGRQTKTMV